MLSTLRKQLLFRSSHRGCKETDILLGRFAEQNIANMDEQELTLYEELVEVQDTDLYNWIAGIAEYPSIYQELIDKIRRFHKLDV